jgi:methylmalonyl-CoA/ethylmalonyl-CoA epimerase
MTKAEGPNRSARAQPGRPAPRSSAVLKIDGFSHLGIVVPDLEDASKHLTERFACEVGKPIDVPEQGLRLVYVELGPVTVELLSPSGPDSPIARFLERNPAGALHHIALRVDDAAAAAEESAAAGMRVLGSGPAPGHHGRPLFFLHPKDTLGALLEIEQGE